MTFAAHRELRIAKLGGRTAAMKIRILVVDDYQPWLRVVRSAIERQEGLLIVGEASDGLQAVAQAQELQPDLILLDIGLPKLNGIEAARRIRQLLPRSRVLFLTENQSPELAEHVLHECAGGYLIKAYAARELQVAIETVLQGKQFVCSALADRVLVHSAERCIQASPITPQPRAEILKAKTRHEVAFYGNDEELVNGFSRQIESDLRIGNPVVVIASQPHRAGILQRLAADGIDVEAATAEARYSAWDNIETLSSIMAGDLPDETLCTAAVARVMSTVAKSTDATRVAIVGECAPVLLAQGNVEGAIRLEQLWDQITRNYAADTLCGYVGGTTPQRNSQAVIERICAEHSAVCG